MNDGREVDFGVVFCPNTPSVELTLDVDPGASLLLWSSSQVESDGSSTFQVRNASGAAGFCSLSFGPFFCLALSPGVLGSAVLSVAEGSI